MTNEKDNKLDKTTRMHMNTSWEHIWFDELQYSPKLLKGLGLNISMSKDEDDKLEAAEGVWKHLSFSGSEPIEKPKWPDAYVHKGTISGRLSQSMPEFQDLPSPTATTTPDGASKLALVLKDLDLSDIELRVMSQLDTDWAELGRRMHQSFGDLGDAFKNLRQQLEYNPLTASDLRGVASIWDRIPMGDKHTQQHADHPTEKNPNHPRFQNQPVRPGKRSTKQRKQR